MVPLITSWGYYGVDFYGLVGLLCCLLFGCSVGVLYCLIYALLYMGFWVGLCVMLIV